MKRYVFIDYENVAGIKKFPKIKGFYFFFFGNTQKRTKVPLSMVLSIQNSHGKFIEIPYTGKNALDMHLAFYMGMVIREFGLTGDKGNFQIFIVSEDKDYDRLISHLNNMFGWDRVFRVKNLDELKKYKKMKQHRIKNKKKLKKLKKKLSKKEVEVFEKTKNMLEAANMTRPKKKENMIHYIRVNAAGNVEVTEDESEKILSVFVDDDMIAIDESEQIRYFM